jgi:uncharacterized protein YkwD
VENPKANPPHYPGITEPEFQPHPYANLFDRLPDDQLAALAEDIERTGQLVPIQLYGGRILDGRNRYAAIALLNQHRKQKGLKPLAVRYGLYLEEESEENDKLAWAFVRANNYFRRLTASTII